MVTTSKRAYRTPIDSTSSRSATDRTSETPKPPEVRRLQSLLGLRGAATGPVYTSVHQRRGEAGRRILVKDRLATAKQPLRSSSDRSAVTRVRTSVTALALRLRARIKRIPGCVPGSYLRISEKSRSSVMNKRL